MATVKLDPAKGVQIPNMTTTERNAVSSPETGALVWNTTTSAVNQYNGSAWGTVGISEDTTKLPLAGGALTGAVTTNSTFDGIDIATRDAILTSTTTTAGAALPKAGGTMTGNLGIGGTADSGKQLHIEGNGTDVGITLKDTAGVQYSIKSDASDFTIKSDSAGAVRLTIDSSGHVGIGQTSPSSANSVPTFLHIGNSSTTQSSIILEDDENKWEIINNGDIAFRIGSTAHFRVANNKIENNTGVFNTTPTTATTSAGWNFNSGGATVTCTQNAIIKIGDCGASGLLLINDTTLNGQMAGLFTGGGVLTFIGATGSWVHSSTPSTSQVGFYRTGSQVYVKNGQAGTVQLGLMTFRTRNAQ
jgi:hypothetical protein